MSTTNPTTSARLHEEVGQVVARLEAAWNEGDSMAFAAEFAVDADFVNIRGAYTSGRDSIARGHAHIWNTIYAGSTVRYSIMHLRELAPGVVLAHLDAQLRVPSGPAAGDTSALPSLVLVLDHAAWQIAAFQNTQRRQD